MIVGTSKEKMVVGGPKHIAFEFNPDYYDSWIEDVVVQGGWLDLYSKKNLTLGTVLSKELDFYTFHALVIYTPEVNTLEDYGEFIKDCLNEIKANGEPIHIGPIGSGFIDSHSDFSFNDVIYGMIESDNDFILHAHYNMKDIDEIYEKQKLKRQGRHK